jgi:hypothetical protein
LYGNWFGRASTESIKKAVKVLNPPTISNIIAMAALGYQDGLYTTSQISDTLNTAYTAFLGARMESWAQIGYNPLAGKEKEKEQQQQHDQHKPDSASKGGSDMGEKKTGGSSSGETKDGSKVPPRVVVHTGNWGAGAFGGDPVLMTTIQMLAARLAGIDEIRFHTFDKRGSDAFEAASILVKDLESTQMSFGLLIAALEKQRFKWGTSNGT